MKTLPSIALALCLAAPFAHADETEKAAPPFNEVLKVISEHLADSDQAELNNAAVKGLLEQLSAHVQLNPGQSEASADAESIAGTNRFRGDFGYIRIGTFKDGLATNFSNAVNALLKDGALRGLIVDLRFVGGNDYGAAARFAGLFADKTPAVISTADEEFKEAAGADAILIPVMVLANSRTSGAAEAAAAVLREVKAALIIGGSTAGQAMMSEDFKLSTGDTLRIATAPVRIGGGKGLPLSGVTPDIRVDVSEPIEREYLNDPYFEDKSLDQSTNINRRVTEADLVRQRREGIPLEQAVADRESSMPNHAKIVTDPALARALDVLKALTVVENWKQD